MINNTADSKNKQEYAYHILKNKIISGDYPQGSPLVELALCEELNVSRTPLREAIRLLSSEGYITVVKGRGASVTQFDYRQFVDLMEFKCMVDGSAAYYCCQRKTPSVAERLQRNMATYQKVLTDQKDSDINNYSEIHQTDCDFHILLAEGSGNQKIKDACIKIIEELEWMVNSFKTVLFNRADYITRWVLEHEKILTAVLADDPAVAEAAAKEHVKNVMEYYRTLIFKW